jgi:hypothetical protein
MPNDKLKDTHEDHREPAGTPEGTPGQDQPSRFARFRGHAGKRVPTDQLMAFTRGE